MVMFPVKFDVSAEATCGISNPWKTSAKNLDPIKVAISPQFNGPGKAYSPEELYGLSILNCLIGIYKHLCENNKIEFKKIESKLTVTINKKTESDELIISHLDININITGSSDKEKARNLLEKAFNVCPVTNSIKAGKTYHININ